MDDLVFLCVSCGKGLSDYEEFCSHVASHDAGSEVPETSTKDPDKDDSAKIQTETQKPDTDAGIPVDENNKKDDNRGENLKCAAAKTFDIRDVEQTCNEILEVAAARKGEHFSSGTTNVDFITQSERQTLQEASKLILLSKLQNEGKIYHTGNSTGKAVVSNGTADFPKPSNQELQRQVRHQVLNKNSKVGIESDFAPGHVLEQGKHLVANEKYGIVKEMFSKRMPGSSLGSCRDRRSKEETSLTGIVEALKTKTEPPSDWSGSQYWTKRYTERHGNFEKDRCWMQERGHADAYGYHSPPGHLVPIHIPIHQPHLEMQTGKTSSVAARDVQDSKNLKTIPHKLHSPCSRNSSVTVPFCQSSKSLPFISDVRSLSHVPGAHNEEGSRCRSPRSSIARSTGKSNHTQTEPNNPTIILEKNQVFEEKPLTSEYQCRKPEKGNCHRDTHSNVSERHSGDKRDHYYVTSYVHPRHYAVHTSTKHTHTHYSKPEVRMSHTYSYYPLQPGHGPLHSFPHHVQHYRFSPHYKMGQYAAPHYSPVVHAGDISDNAREQDTGGSDISSMPAEKSRGSCNCAQCFRKTHHRGPAHYRHSPTSLPVQETKKVTQNEATQTSRSPCECDGKIQASEPQEKGREQFCGNGRSCTAQSTCIQQSVENRICFTEKAACRTGDHRCKTEDGTSSRNFQEMHRETLFHGKSSTLPPSFPRSCKIELEHASGNCIHEGNGRADSTKLVTDTLLPLKCTKGVENTDQTVLAEEQIMAQIRSGKKSWNAQMGTQVTVKAEPMDDAGDQAESGLQLLTCQESLTPFSPVKQEEGGAKCVNAHPGASLVAREDVDCQTSKAADRDSLDTLHSNDEFCTGMKDSEAAISDMTTTDQPELVESLMRLPTEPAVDVEEEWRKEEAHSLVPATKLNNNDLSAVSQDSTSDSCGSNWETLLCNEGTVPLSPSRTKSFATNCTTTVPGIFVYDREHPNGNDQAGYFRSGLAQDGTLKQPGFLRVIRMKDADMSESENGTTLNMSHISGIPTMEVQDRPRPQIRTVFRDNNQNDVVVVSLRPGVRGETFGYTNNSGFISLNSLDFCEEQKKKVVDEVPPKRGKPAKGQTYECDVCSRSYASYDEMFVHRRTHRQTDVHKDPQVQSTKKVPRVLCPRYIVCKFCDKTFQTSSDYGNHVAFECQNANKKLCETENSSEMPDAQMRPTQLATNTNESTSSSHAAVTSNTCMREMTISVAGEEKLVSVVHPLLPSFPVAGNVKEALLPSSKGSPVVTEASARQHGPQNSCIPSETGEQNKSIQSGKDRDDPSQGKEFTDKLNPLTGTDSMAPAAVTNVTEPQSADQPNPLDTKAALQAMQAAGPVTNFLVGNNLIQGQLFVTSTGTYILPTKNVVLQQKSVSSKGSAGYRPLLPKSMNESNIDNACPSTNVGIMTPKETLNNQTQAQEGSGGRKKATKRKHSGDEDFHGPVDTDTSLKKSSQGELNCSRCQGKFLDDTSYRLHMDKCGNSSRYNFRGRKTSYREFYESDDSISDD